LSAIEIGLLSILAVLIFVYAGVHIGISLGVSSFLCIWAVRDNFDIAGKMLAIAAGESLAQYDFGVAPLFVLMGLLISISDMGKDIYEVANQIFRRVKGGLGVATVAANAVFSAVTGTSVAAAAVFTKIAVPEMLKFGYNPKFAVGVVAGSTVLGMLIPPSLLFVLYGIITETSIGQLLIAGIVPGVLLSCGYAFTIWLMATRFPGSVLIDETKADVSKEPLMGAVEMWNKAGPITLLIILVLGGLYGGVFTATECAGVGAGGALLIALAKRKLTWKSLWQILIESGHLTAAISFLIISANLYARMISVTGIPNAMEAWINHLGIGFYGLVAIYLVIILFLGTLLDSASTTLIAVPLFIPLLVPMGADPIWLGVITIIAVEIGLLTPPLGITVFVVHSTLGDPRISVDDIFRGAFPFLMTTFTFLLIMVAFPDLALVLN
jgi:tripartite ATP-independent transporter DctM subunit